MRMRNLIKATFLGRGAVRNTCWPRAKSSCPGSMARAATSDGPKWWTYISNRLTALAESSRDRTSRTYTTNSERPAGRGIARKQHAGFLQALLAHDARVKAQDVERDRAGYNRFVKRSEVGWSKVVDIEKAIEKHTGEGSVLALGASLVIGIHADDKEENVLAAYRASLRAIRPQLVGAIAEDADRVAEKYEEAA
jgi:hypothetical protein